jgi:hypothetical protein
MVTNSNTILYATRATRRVHTVLASALAANSYTQVALADATYGSMITDLILRNTDSAAVTFSFIICAPGDETDPESTEGTFTLPSQAGNNGGATALCSVSAILAVLFDIDLAGNRIITLEPGMAIYLKNHALLAQAIYCNAKLRDYNP